jgi:hypothetical protein
MILGVAIMTETDRTYLQRILDDNRAEARPEMDPDKYFEVFSAEQVLKKYELNDSEIESGIVGKGGDGGIDSIYCFIDRLIVREDTSISHLKKANRPVRVELVVIQSKNGRGSFNAAVLDKLLPTVTDLFNIAHPISASAKHYNKKLVDILDRFRKHYLDLVRQRPALSITFHYVCQGEELHPDVVHRKDLLLAKVKELFPSAQTDLRFVGAKALMGLYDLTPPAKIELTAPKIMASGEGYVCLVPLKNFFDFISDNEKELVRHIFESNVRDYQGNVKVNKDIHETLVGKGKEEFWWLNNGVTILASDVYQATGEKLIISDPQIVNGLQTSRVVHTYFRESGKETDPRSILVRVVKTQDQAARDRIIKATNSQTSIPDAWLHATEELHRRIEDYFVSHGLYYDRRKNFYKNLGKPASKIVTIPRLAQAVTAVFLQRPDNARARPSTVLRKTYTLVFHRNHAPDLYLKCAQLLNVAAEYLSNPTLGLMSTEQNNLEFHLAMYMSCMITKKVQPSPEDIEHMVIPKQGDKLIGESLKIVDRFYKRLGSDDIVAKGQEFVTRLREEIAKKLGASEVIDKVQRA